MRKSNYYITKEDYRMWGNDEYRRIYRAEVSGYTFTVNGVDFGITKERNGWTITHIETGMACGTCKLKREATPYIECNLDKLKKQIEANTPGKCTLSHNVVACGWDLYRVCENLRYNYGHYRDLGIDGVWNDDTEEFQFAKSLFDDDTIIRVEYVA